MRPREEDVIAGIRAAECTRGVVLCLDPDPSCPVEGGTYMEQDLTDGGASPRQMSRNPCQNTNRK